MSDTLNPFKQVQNSSDYVDLEAFIVLPALHKDGREFPRGIELRFTYDVQGKHSFGSVNYEIDGSRRSLCEIPSDRLPVSLFCEITGAQVPEVKLAALASVQGNVFFKDGVATLPDGTVIDLRVV